MKKAMLISVSGAALMFAVSAHASGSVKQSEAFLAANVQGEAQSSSNYAGGGDGGTAKVFAAGGDAGSSGSSPVHSYGPSKSSSGGSGGDGGLALAKAYGGDGGSAASRNKQAQGQGQVVAGTQTQEVILPDINVTVATPSTGGGGASGPGASTGDGGNAIGDNADDNKQQSPSMEDVSDSAQATFRSRAAADIGGDAFLGDNVNNNSFNTTMKNETTMRAENKIDDISVSSGDSTGGNAKGGDLTQVVKADNTNLGKTGAATTVVKDVEGGKGGSGGDAKALSANVSLQAAKSTDVSKGGDGKGYSSAYGKADADADAKAGSLAASANLGKNSNRSSAFALGSGSGSGKPSRYGHSSSSSPSADASGSAKQWQDSDAFSAAFAKPTANAKVDSASAASGTGGNGGDISSKTANLSSQNAKTSADGGNGAAGGAANVLAASTSGDLTQKASSYQTSNAATGATQGGNGGNISVAFGTGAIGGIGIGTMSGIANIAQNTGLTANQFSSFSINAHTN